jgi:hypothetical protein
MMKDKDGTLFLSSAFLASKMLGRLAGAKVNVVGRLPIQSGQRR